MSCLHAILNSLCQAFLISSIFCGCTLQYTIAMLGYDEEEKTTVLELTYNYGVTEYTKGNAYAQVIIFFSLPSMRKS